MLVNGNGKERSTVKKHAKILSKLLDVKILAIETLRREKKLGCGHFGEFFHI